MADWGDGKHPLHFIHCSSANNTDDWGVSSAAAVPLPNGDMDVGFGTPAVSVNVSAVKNNNTVVSTYEFPADTPAATPDGDDWGAASSGPAAKAVANDDFGIGGDDFGGAPAAGRDSGFGDDGFGDGPGEGFGGGASGGSGDEDPFEDGPAGGDATDLNGTPPTGEDAHNARAGDPMGPPRKDPTSIFRGKLTADHSDSGSKAKESHQARFDSRQDQGQGLPRVLHRRAFRALRWW